MTSIIAIFAYIGTAYGLMCIGQTCGLKNPWLSWIPYANVYQLGAVADHYTERNQNRKTKQRNTLLILYILATVITGICIIAMLSSVFGMLADAGLNYMEAYLDPEAFKAQMEAFLASQSEAEKLSTVSGVLVSTAGFLLALPVLIAYAVCNYIALHRIYKLMDPANATVYTVLSVLFNIATPIIFLIIAKKSPVYPAEGPFFESPANTYDGGSDAGSNTYSI